jgi:hypothetical protein
MKLIISIAYNFFHPLIFSKNTPTQAPFPLFSEKQINYSVQKPYAIRHNTNSIFILKKNKKSFVPKFFFFEWILDLIPFSNLSVTT